MSATRKDVFISRRESAAFLTESGAVREDIRD